VTVSIGAPIASGPRIPSSAFTKYLFELGAPIGTVTVRVQSWARPKE
jgi:hypothetical protein